MAKLKEVADALGVSKNTVMRAIDELGIKADHVTKEGNAYVVDAIGCSAIAGRIGNRTDDAAPSELDEMTVKLFDQQSTIEQLRLEVADLKTQLEDARASALAATQTAADLAKQTADLNAQLNETRWKMDAVNKENTSYKMRLSTIANASLFQRIFAIQHIAALPAPADNVSID